MAHLISRLKWSDDDRVSRIYHHYNDLHAPYRYQSMKIFRNAEDPDIVSLLFEWDDADNMQQFIADPTIQDVMSKTSVITPETFPIRKKTP